MAKRKAPKKPAARARQSTKRARTRALKVRREPVTLRLRDLSPSFTVQDLERSLRWYCDLLGFIVDERWEHEGRLQGAALKAGLCSLYLSQDDFAKGRKRVKGVGFSLHCRTVQGVDALAARAQRGGARLAEEPTDRPWGVRSFSIVDPDGFKLVIYRQL